MPTHSNPFGSESSSPRRKVTTEGVPSCDSAPVMDFAELIRRAREWAEADPDPITKEEIQDLASSPEPARTDLADRFGAALEFGTAGLRGVIGGGPNRMNRAVVIKTTWGL